MEGLTPSEALEIVLEHLKGYYIAYIIAIICLIPLIYFTKRYSLPLIWYLIELMVYLVVMHLVFHVLVLVTAWFRGETTMRYGDMDMDTSVDWTTPLIEVWTKALYEPEALFYVECALAVLILFLRWYIRPFRPSKKKKAPDKKKPLSGSMSGSMMGSNFGASKFGGKK